MAALKIFYIAFRDWEEFQVLEIAFTSQDEAKLYLETMIMAMKEVVRQTDGKLWGIEELVLFDTAEEANVYMKGVHFQ